MRINTPCHADWRLMTPTETGRHCSACDKNVVDLTRLPIPDRRNRVQEIEEGIANGKHFCVNSHIDRDGMLAGSRRVLTGGMALLLAMTIAGCQGDGPEVSARDQTSTESSEPVDTKDEKRPATHDAIDTRYQVLGEVCVPPPMPIRRGEPAAEPLPNPHANS